MVNIAILTILLMLIITMDGIVRIPIVIPTVMPILAVMLHISQIYKKGIF